MNDSDSFYLLKDEPIKSCLLAMRQIILDQDPNISAAWKYGMPFFCYKGKMFCYLWIHKKYKQPYIGIVEGKHIHHALLKTENRSRMKILLIDPNKDLPLNTITGILQEAIHLYTLGIIQIS